MPERPVTSDEFNDMPAAGGSCTVKVTSNGEWRTSTDDGIAVNPSSGSGNASVTVTVPANATGQARDVKVTFCSAQNASLSKTVIIHQESMSISVTPSGKRAKCLGEEFTFTVTADGAWGSSADTDGVNVSPSTQSAGTQSVKVQIPANVTGKTRRITVKFWLTQNESISNTVTIEQESVYVGVNQTSMDISASGGKFVVKVTADGEWETSVEEWTDSDGMPISTSDRIVLSPSEGTGDQSVTVTVPVNTTGREREVIMWFYSTLEARIGHSFQINQKA